MHLNGTSMGWLGKIITCNLNINIYSVLIINTIIILDKKKQYKRFNNKEQQYFANIQSSHIL